MAKKQIIVDGTSIRINKEGYVDIADQTMPLAAL